MGNIPFYTSIAALIVAIVNTASSQVLYKSYFVTRNKIKLIGCIVLFLSVPLCNYLALKNLPIHYVYTSTSITQVILLVMAKFFLNESISKDKLMAVGLILLGITFFNIPLVHKS
jgi:multidrug transporter EmrE-like cation transporter